MDEKKDYTGKFIGEKKVKSVVFTDQKTPGGIQLVEVEFENGDKELFSVLMFGEIVTDEATNPSDLRDMRVRPVVSAVLSGLRDWGIKVGETAYFGALLNQSLNYNLDEAVKQLWSGFMPKPLSTDDVTLIAVDQVLKSVPPVKMEDVIREIDK